jgi:hypothetical protein
MMKRIVPFIILSIFLCLMVVLFVPDLLFKPTEESSIPFPLLEGEGSGMPDYIVVQKIRKEVVFQKLSEIALQHEFQPPLPKVSLFPSEKLKEQAKIMILKDARFYHELKEIIQGEERQQQFFNVPRPQTADVTRGDIPLPDDVVAKEFIASLRETAQRGEEAQKNTSEDTTLDIRGPAASRKINYIPPPLQLKSSVDGDTLLKFWVFPDGTVGKVIPLISEDTRVYTVAINHIKKYRFEPLPKDSPQVETWGVIPVKSVLR